MKFPFNLLWQCCSFHRVLQNGVNQTPNVSSTLVKFHRVFHCGLFATENMYRRILLQNNVEVLKRNASKKAKNKNKASSGANLAAKVDLSIGSEIIDLAGVKSDMVNVMKRLSDEFQRKYSTRLTSNTLDSIHVTIDGIRSSLYEVAVVKSGDNEFLITPMTGEKKDEKILLQAIQNSLNVNPILDGSVIRIPISVASSEYKENILKLAKASAEKSKVDIRKIRQQSIANARKREGSSSKDTIRLIEKQIQLLTDAYSQDIEDILSKKSLELNPEKK